MTFHALLITFILFGILSANRCAGENRKKPRALIHIGPHKTGSTHLQLNLRRFVDRLEQEGYYYPKLNEDTGYDVKDAALFGHYLHGNGTGSERVMSTTAKMKEFLRQSAEKKRNIIISVENFSTLSGEQVKMLRDALNAFDVTIVMAYREWLSRFKSYYSEISFNTGGDTSPFLTMLFEEATSHKQFLNVVIDRYAEAFGWDRIIVLDYFGMAAAKKDLVYVIFCEIGNFLCSVTKDMNQGTKHENPSKNWLPRELLEVFRNYVGANHGCDMPRSGLKEALKIFRSNSTCSKCRRPPSRWLNLEPLYTQSVNYDLNLREKYGKLMRYENVAANRQAMRAVQVEELIYWRIYDDPYWKQWMREQFVNLQQKRLVICEK